MRIIYAQSVHHRQPHPHPHGASAPPGTSRRATLLAVTIAALPLSEAAIGQQRGAVQAAQPAGPPTQSGVEALYDRSAASYDALDDGPLSTALGFPALRTQLLAKARGEVLELAVGTGLNLSVYPWQRLTSLTAVDLSKGMLQQAQQRAAAMGLSPTNVTFQQADASALTFPSGSFDTIVDTFSLCTFEQPLEALRGAARLLHPGGRLLLLEHARSRQPFLGAYQDATAGLIASTGGRGCVWNQRVPELVEAAGFEILLVEEHLGGLLVSVEAQLREAE